MYNSHGPADNFEGGKLDFFPKLLHKSHSFFAKNRSSWSRVKGKLKIFVSFESEKYTLSSETFSLVKFPFAAEKGTCISA